MKQRKEPTTANLKQLTNIMKMLPQSMVDIQLKAEWAKKTKCLDKPQENIKEIKNLQNPITKTIYYQKLPVYEWLQKIIKHDPLTQEDKDFIQWYKKEYAVISLRKQGILK